MYTAISSDCGVGLWCLYHHVILLECLSGSVKIQKHSARLFLQVIDGLKVISLLHCLALSFLSLCSHQEHSIWWFLFYWVIFWGDEVQPCKGLCGALVQVTASHVLVACTLLALIVFVLSVGQVLDWVAKSC